MHTRRGMQSGTTTCTAQTKGQEMGACTRQSAQQAAGNGQGSTQPVLTRATLQRSHDRTATITGAAAVLRAGSLHTAGAQPASARRG